MLHNFNYSTKSKTKRKKKSLPPLTEVEEIDLVRKGSKFHMLQDTRYLAECNKALDAVKFIMDSRDELRQLNDKGTETRKKPSSLPSGILNKPKTNTIISLDDTEQLVDELLEILAEDLELINTESQSNLSNNTLFYEIGDRVITTEFFHLKDMNYHKAVQEETILQITEIGSDGTLHVQVDDNYSCQFFKPLWLPPLHLNKLKKIRDQEIILVTGWEKIDDDNFTILYNGYYILQPIPHAGKPWYKMENSLRHIKWNHVDKCWVFLNGRIHYGSGNADARCEDNANRPTDIQESWMVEIRGEWVPESCINITAKFYCPNRRSIRTHDYSTFIGD